MKFNSRSSTSKILFLVAFTLPMYMGLNNVILGVFLLWTIINGIIKKEKPNPKNLKAYLPIFLFFVLALIASINNTDTLFFKHLESYWSFLLIPIAFSFQQEKGEVLIKYTFKGLIYGCAATLILCYANTIYEIIAYHEPWKYFLRWRHLSHDFTEIADTHPAYLGLFICTSAFYLLFYNKAFSKRLKVVLLILFTLGLFQLASRMALLIYILLFGIYFILRISKYKKQLALFLIFFGCLFTLFFSFGSEYLKDRIFSIQSIEKDDRFERFQISYELFKEHPILGVGFDKVEEQRIEKYTEQGYIVAAHYKYNAHNQFMEYLSINGIMGVLAYIFVFLYLIFCAIKTKDYLFLFIFFTFFIANLTESMMVRIKGIEYFALVASLFLSKFNNQQSSEKKIERT